MHAVAEQLNFALLADTPIARRSDPVTSKIAAKEITKSGSRGMQQAAVHSWVRTFPGHTSQELADLCLHNGGTMDRYVFARRLSEIAASEDPRSHKPLKALCYSGKLKRKCRVTGHLALVWYPL